MTNDPSENRDLAGVRAASPSPAPNPKKRRPFSAKVLFRRLILVTILLVAIVIAAGLFGRPFARCMTLRHAIKDALASATQVRVVEHSNVFDRNRQSGDEDYREKIYATVILTPQQVAELRRTFPISLDYGNVISHLCRFNDHHRIEAVQPDSTTFVLDLCFRCDDLRISGEHVRLMPLQWNTPLRKFITSLGMKPDGPWKNR